MQSAQEQIRVLRMLRFLMGLSDHRVRDALVPLGFSDEVLAQGQDLLQLALVTAEQFVPAERQGKSEHPVEQLMTLSRFAPSPLAETLIAFVESIIREFHERSPATTARSRSDIIEELWFWYVRWTGAAITVLDDDLLVVALGLPSAAPFTPSAPWRE